jgi:malonate-semialdehyde dehydrogenase (acetylating)/methylmalonate-semialdehyde dehydrogenase
MADRISHWIDGGVVAGESGRTGPVYNPATGLQTAEVDLASTADPTFIRLVLISGGADFG